MRLYLTHCRSGMVKNSNKELEKIDHLVKPSQTWGPEFGHNSICMVACMDNPSTGEVYETGRSVGLTG